MSYYQFNLSLDGSRYIRGEKTHDNDEFFTIKEPIFKNCALSIDGVKRIDNNIQLSKSVVICYFEIQKD